MDLLFSLGFVAAGVACLWAAFTGKPFYPARGPGASDRPRIPLGPLHGRIMYTIMGLSFLITGIGSFVLPRFGRPPTWHH